MTKYAYILQGKVMYIEDRDVDIKNLVAPDLTDRFIPIPEGTTVKPGMIYSDGEFMADPVAPADVLTKYQNLLLQRDAQYKAVIQPLAAAATTLTDAQAVNMPGDVFPTWPAGTDDEGNYNKGQIIQHNGSLYKVKKTGTPDTEPGEDNSMYKLLSTGHAGTLEDPIPFVYGMDVKKNTYYSYVGVTYLCTKNVKACVDDPESGAKQWEAVNG